MYYRRLYTTILLYRHPTICDESYGRPKYRSYNSASVGVTQGVPSIASCYGCQKKKVILYVPSDLRGHHYLTRATSTIMMSSLFSSSLQHLKGRLQCHDIKYSSTWHSSHEVLSRTHAPIYAKAICCHVVLNQIAQGLIFVA